MSWIDKLVTFLTHITPFSHDTTKGFILVILGLLAAGVIIAFIDTLIKRVLRRNNRRSTAPTTPATHGTSTGQKWFNGVIVVLLLGTWVVMFTTYPTKGDVATSIAAIDIPVAYDDSTLIARIEEIKTAVYGDDTTQGTSDRLTTLEFLFVTAFAHDPNNECWQTDTSNRDERGCYLRTCNIAVGGIGKPTAHARYTGTEWVSCD